MTTLDTVGADLALRLDRDARAEAPPAVDPPVNVAGEVAAPPLPSTIDVDYWTEADGTIGGHCAILNVTAVGDTPGEFFAAMAKAIGEYWDILNASYETLSDELRRHLQLRFSPIVFHHQP